MIFSRHLYWIILLHVVLILANAGTGTWLIISQRGFVIGTLLIICSFLQISGLVNKLNSFNQKLRIFFDAIEDKDNMLYFPEQNVSKEQEKLNRSLNRINLLLAKPNQNTPNRNISTTHSWKKYPSVYWHGILPER